MLCSINCRGGWWKRALDRMLHARGEAVWEKYRRRQLYIYIYTYRRRRCDDDFIILYYVTDEYVFYSRHKSVYYGHIGVCVTHSVYINTIYIVITVIHIRQAGVLFFLRRLLLWLCSTYILFACRYITCKIFIYMFVYIMRRWKLRRRWRPTLYSNNSNNTMRRREGKKSLPFFFFLLFIRRDLHKFYSC